MPLRVHAHVSHYDDQQYHFRKPQFSTAQRVCDPANNAAALCATFRNTTTKPTVIKDPSACEYRKATCYAQVVLAHRKPLNRSFCSVATRTPILTSALRAAAK
jgi:hypothetical protein